MHRISPGTFSTRLTARQILDHVNTPDLQIIRVGLIPYAIDATGRILVLIGRRHDTLLIADFGGGCKMSERPLKALQRELQEEVGDLLEFDNLETTLQDDTTVVIAARESWGKDRLCIDVEFMVRIPYDPSLPSRFNVVGGELLYVEWWYLSLLTDEMMSTPFPIYLSYLQKQSFPATEDDFKLLKEDVLEQYQRHEGLLQGRMDAKLTIRILSPIEPLVVVT